MEELLEVLGDANRARLNALLIKTPRRNRWLIAYAAFPVALTSDLLYKIWMNFRSKNPADTGNSPLSQVSLILLSPICREIGRDVYEIYPSIRTVLLQYARQHPETGISSVEEQARFLSAYVDQCRHKISSAAFAEAQRWTAEAYIKPEKAAETLLQSISAGVKNGWSSSRIHYYISWAKQMGVRTDDGIAGSSGHATNPLATALRLAEGVDLFNKGQTDASMQKFESLKDLFEPPENLTEQSFRTHIPRNVWDQMNIDAKRKKEETDQPPRHVVIIIKGILLGRRIKLIHKESRHLVAETAQINSGLDLYLIANTRYIIEIPSLAVIREFVTDQPDDTQYIDPIWNDEKKYLLVWGSPSTQPTKKEKLMSEAVGKMAREAGYGLITSGRTAIDLAASSAYLEREERSYPILPELVQLTIGSKELKLNAGFIVDALEIGEWRSIVIKRAFAVIVIGDPGKAEHSKLLHPLELLSGKLILSIPDTGPSSAALYAQIIANPYSPLLSRLNKIIRSSKDADIIADVIWELCKQHEGNPFPHLPLIFLDDSPQPEYMLEGKMFVLGDAGTAKTTLVKRIIGSAKVSEPAGTYPSQIRRSEYVFPVNKGELTHPSPIMQINPEFKLNIFEFEISPLNQDLTRFLFDPDAIYVVVADTEESAIRLNFYLETIALFAPGSPVLVVGTSTKILNFDLTNKPSLKNIQLFRTDLSRNVRRDMAELRRIIRQSSYKLSNSGKLKPSQWPAIQRMLNEDRPSILSPKDFAQICSSHDLSAEEARELNQYLHYTGDLLNIFGKSSFDEIILLRHVHTFNAFLKVLNSPLIQLQNGRFSETDLKEIWIDEWEERVTLLVLMEGLSLIIRTEVQNNYIVFRHLPAGAPRHTSPQGSVRTVFTQRSGVSTSVLYSLASRLRHYLSFESLCKDGMTIEWEGSSAEITHNDGVTIVKTKGENKIDLATIIGSELKSIYAGYPTLHLETWIACNCYQCKNDTSPHFYEDVTLHSRPDKGRNTTVCAESGSTVNINNLLAESIKNKIPDYIEIEYSDGAPLFISTKQKHRKLIYLALSINNNMPVDSRIEQQVSDIMHTKVSDIDLIWDHYDTYDSIVEQLDRARNKLTVFYYRGASSINEISTHGYATIEQHAIIDQLCQISHYGVLKLVILFEPISQDDVKTLLEGGVPAVLCVSTSITDHIISDFMASFFDCLINKYMTLKNAYSYSLTLLDARYFIRVSGRDFESPNAFFPGNLESSHPLKLFCTNTEALDLNPFTNLLPEGYSPYKPTELFTNTLAEAFQHEGAPVFLSSEKNIRDEKGSAKLAQLQILIMDQLPYPIAKGLRIIFSTRYHKENDFLPIAQGFISVFQSSIEFLNMVMLSCLYEFQSQHPHIKLSRELKDILNVLIFKKETARAIDAQIHLARQIHVHIVSSGGTHFMPELNNLFDPSAGGNRFIIDCEYLTGLSNTLREGTFTKDQETYICESAEKRLSDVLSNLSFFCHYEFLSVRRIEVINPTGSKARMFTHNVIYLKGATSDTNEFFVSRSILEQGVLVIRSLKNKTLQETLDNDPQYISLSPFVIDFNAFENFESGEILFLDSATQDDKVYFYKSPTDLAREARIFPAQYQRNNRSPLADDFIEKLEKFRSFIMEK